MTIVESNATVQEQATSATEGLKNRSSRNGGVSEPLRVNGDRDRASLEPSVELAAQAQHVGDLNAALAHWQRIREQFPEDPRGYSGCGAVLRNLNRLIDAESVLHEGSRKFPSDQNIADTHAWVAHSSGDLPEANRRWTAIRASFPHSFAGYFGGGAILRAMRRFDEADEIYRLAFARFPASSVLLADFASVAQARGDLREASRRWIVLNTLFPNQLDGFLREARALREAGLYGEAENVAADALKCFPGNVTALIESAQIAQQRGHGAEALRRWEAVITDFPGLVDGYTGAARALNELGRFADAQNVLQPAVRKFPDSIEAASLSARTEHYLGKFPEAAIRWKAIRERFPTQTTGYIGGAESLLATGNTEDATELVETASRIFPEDLHVAMQFARVAELAQNWNEAVRRWKAVVERFPDRPAVIAGYALSLSRSGNSADADKILEAAIAQPMSAIELYQAYAECASQRRDWPVAAARWRHSVDIFPDRVNAWTGLGESLRNAGRLEESANLLTAALQRYPDNVELERQIAVTASAQRAWTVALPLWEKLKRKYPRNSAVRSGITQALWQAQQDIGVVSSGNTEGAAPFEIPPLLLEADELAEDSGALRTLLMKFESIGDTCEFGIVQRRFGAEPISLLRWASTPPASLLLALNTKFEGVGEAENTVIEISQGEYATRDKRYHMFSHTFTPETAAPLEKFTTQHLRRMSYLRRKLIEDLGSGEKVFVYKSTHGISDDEARALFRAIRRYGGQSALLVVRLADEIHPRGTLLTMEGGLFMGYIDRFSTVDINVDGWVELCKKTDATWRPEPTQPLQPELPPESATTAVSL